MPKPKPLDPKTTHAVMTAVIDAQKILAAMKQAKAQPIPKPKPSMKKTIYLEDMLNVSDVSKLKAGSPVVLVEPKTERRYRASGANPYAPSFQYDGALNHIIAEKKAVQKTLDALKELGVHMPVIGRLAGIGTAYGIDARIQWGLEDNSYSYSEHSQREIFHLDEYLAAAKELYGITVSMPDIKYNELDKLVLTEEKRKSIISVIKQHKNSSKIFDEWGLASTIEYGKGMTMLFHGPPGTGKTWAANCIAKSLSKKLKVVDNSILQSSTPGEMERNIKQAFEEATRSKEVILFDECDSLLMSRGNVGMILGSEINCLLTEIEKFEGICILTTNRIGELDEALERRISLIVKFPKPDEDQRKLIWKRLLPKKMPLNSDVDFEALHKLDVAGGHIKNIILNAARHAVSEDSEDVKMSHFEAAAAQSVKGNQAFGAPSKAPGGKYIHADKTRS